MEVISLRRFVILGYLSSHPMVIAAAPGSASASFLELGTAARVVSMGEAFTGLADDVNAIGYNPSGLAFLSRQEAAFMHHEHVSEISQDYVAYAVPFRFWGSLGVSASTLRVPPFPAYDVNDRPQGAVSAQDAAVGAAYANNWGSLGLGVGWKHLRSRLADARAGGSAWDAGILWAVDSKLSLGAVVQNVGPDLKYVSEDFPLPLSGKFGASYRLKVLGSGRIIGALDAGFPRDRSAYLRAGLELAPVHFAAVRLGYNGSLDSGTGFSIGGGLKLIHAGTNWLSATEYSQSVPEVEVGYAFVNMGDLGLSHRIGLLVRFGRPKNEDEYQWRQERSSMHLYYE